MKINIIKVGGNVVEDERMLQDFACRFAALEGPKVLVHGGGKMTSAMQKNLGIEPVMIAGRRVTDARTLEIATMVYAGWCNKHTVASLQKNGCNAIGLSGADGKAVTASKRPPVMVAMPDAAGQETSRQVDYGFVGDIMPDGVNTSLLEMLLERGMTPVLCAITYDGDGSLLNTNADTVASSIAEAFASAGHETTLTFCFEKDGVLEDKDDPDSIIPEITPQYYEALKAERRVADGMIPKIDNAFRAIRHGVSRVVIKNAGNLLNAKGTSIIL